MLPPLRTLRLEDRTLVQLQDNMTQALGRLMGPNGLAMLDGVVVPSTTITGGADQIVTHKLGRTPQGWLITDISAAATVYRASWTSTTITLHPSATCAVALWVW